MLLTRTVKKAFAGALVAVAMLVSTARIDAATVIYASINGGNYVKVADNPFGDTLFAGTFGGTFFGVLTNTQIFGPQNAILNTSEAVLTNTTAASATLSLVFAGDSYLGPTTPPTVFVTSTVASSQSIGASALTYQSYVVAGNKLGQAVAPPNTPDVVTSPNLAILPSQSPTFTGLNGALVGPGLSATGTIPVLPAPFTIGQKLDFTVAAGGTLQMNASTQLVVPEPASMSILGVGLLGAAGYGIRRRKTQVSA